MKQRILSLLLALALLCAMLPQITWPAHAEPATSGTCGDNLTWRFDSDTGTLTVEGSGDMYDFEYFDSQPWYSFLPTIKNVVLSDGVTSISDWAFFGCTRMISVCLPDGLTSIGYMAFRCCTALTSIMLPDGLTSLGDCAFRDCTELAEVIFPDGLTSIGEESFYNCIGLTHVMIPEKVTAISSKAIGYWWDKEDDVEKRVKGFTIYGYEGTASHTYAKKNKFRFIALDSDSNICGDNLTWRFDQSTGTLSVEGSGAMYDCFDDQQPWYGFVKSIKKVVLPDELTELGGFAFNMCSALTSVNLPNGLTSIPMGVFYGCSSLTSIVFPDGLTDIGGGAFYGCTALTSVSFPDAITYIENNAFLGCTALTSVVIPANVTHIGTEAFGYYRDGDSGESQPLENFTIYGYMGTVAHNYAKENNFTFVPLNSNSGICGENLTWRFDLGTGTLTIEGSGKMYDFDWNAQPWYAHMDSIEQIAFPAGLTSIGEYAFYDCTGLTSVTFPAGLTSIGDCAFSYCTGLTSVTFPAGLTSIGDCAFQYCTGLTSIVFPDGLEDIGWFAFLSCTELTSVVIPQSVSEIKEDAFGYWLDDESFECFVYLIEGFTIYGCKGTAAQTYAQTNGIKFVPLDPQSGFADVKPKHYYYNAMLWALENGITSGTSRVTFSPNETCTRGQVMTFLYAAKGKPEADWSNNPFVDVKKSKYYFKPVLWAFQNGITNGVDATHFQPNGGCTRAQVVTFLWALSGKPNPAEGSNPFKDVKKSNWYYKAVLWAYQNGITRGVDDTHFGPNQTCTRGQVVTFLYALLGK